MRPTDMPQTPWRRWTVPAVAVGLGLVYLVAGLLGDDLPFGIFGLVLMVTAGAIFALAGRRSETVAGLLDRRDERINHLDATASLVAGMVVLGAVFIMLVVEIARGQDGLPYSALGALGGVSYVVALAVLRYRR